MLIKLGRDSSPHNTLWAHSCGHTHETLVSRELGPTNPQVHNPLFLRLVFPTIEIHMVLYT